MQHSFTKYIDISLRECPRRARCQRKRGRQFRHGGRLTVLWAAAPERESKKYEAYKGGEDLDEEDEEIISALHAWNSEFYGVNSQEPSEIQHSDPKTPTFTPSRSRASLRSGRRSRVKESVAMEDLEEQEEESPNSAAIDADAIFEPDTDPSTHVLPPSFSSEPSERPNAKTWTEIPDSFSHDVTQAPSPSDRRDPLAEDLFDPETLSRTMNEQTEYERLYDEYGLGSVTFSSSEDEDVEGDPSGHRREEKAATEPAGLSEHGDSNDNLAQVAAQAALREAGETAAGQTKAGEDVDASEDSGAEDETDLSEDEVEEGDEGARHSAVLLELAGATPETLEELIAKHRHSLDETLLEQLYSRIQVAKKFNEDEDVVSGLVLLFQRLRNEVERRQATPSMRLLDDLLHLMDSDTTSSEAARLEEAAERMDSAFDVQGGGEQVDIFAVAAALGHGARSAVDDAMVEFVQRQDFVREVRGLLQGAKERMELLEVELEQKEAAFREACDAGSYSFKEENAFRLQLDTFRERYQHSMTSVRWASAFLQHALGEKIGEKTGTPPEATSRHR